MKQTCLGPPAGEWQGQKANHVCQLQPAWSGSTGRDGVAQPAPALGSPHSLLSSSRASSSVTVESLPQGPGIKMASPRPLRTLGPPPYHPATTGAQSSARKAGPAAASPHHWQAKGGPLSRTLPGPGSPRPAQNARPLARERPSPFGIPYSKLSESKHLKARTGGSQWASSDSKRRAQALRDHKNP